MHSLNRQFAELLRFEAGCLQHDATEHPDDLRFAISAASIANLATAVERGSCAKDIQKIDKAMRRIWQCPKDANCFWLLPARALDLISGFHGHSEHGRLLLRHIAERVPKWLRQECA